ncbi:hypothetical protein ALNOE001_10370 [Candidatus Methanobinarius endosymbioticus]|uniref:Uncharacterized protein n=1 Tax=Candidatus Methanobinarius endosymbioticus TaxID=2006182 RepID=A0A366MB56_9EURY|nr:hypothetical protein ALNOE001_10370 [Candidatus Methanobinarius endosymbioticus]
MSIFGVNLTFNEFIELCNHLDMINYTNKLFEDIISYRGLKSTPIIEKYIKNKRFHEKGFCSSIFDKDITIEKAAKKDKNKNITDFDWIMEIYALKNAQKVYLYQYSVTPIEQKFLLPPGIYFKFLI